MHKEAAGYWGSADFCLPEPCLEQHGPLLRSALYLGRTAVQLPAADEGWEDRLSSPKSLFALSELSRQAHKSQSDNQECF